MTEDNVATSKEKSCQTRYITAELANYLCIMIRPWRVQRCEISLASYTVESTMDNGNDLPARTVHLEFSDERQSTK